MNNPTIYIIGKIKNNPNYQEDFAKAEERLTKIFGEKARIINPALFQYDDDLMGIYEDHIQKLKEHLEQRFDLTINPHEEYKYMDLSMFLISSAVDYIYVLPNSNESKGAFVETILADKYDKKYIFEVNITEKSLETALTSMRIAKETTKEKVGIYMLPNWNLAVLWESIYPKDTHPIAILTDEDKMYEEYLANPEEFIKSIKENGWLVWGDEISFYLVVQSNSNIVLSK